MKIKLYYKLLMTLVFCLFLAPSMASANTPYFTPPLPAPVSTVTCYDECIINLGSTYVGTVTLALICNEFSPQSFTAKLIMNNASTPQHSITCGPPAPTLSIEAEPNVVDVGLSSEIIWTVTGATSCNAGGNWGGAKAFSDGTYTETVTPVYPSSTYSLTCSGPGGDATRSVTVSTPSADISATPCSMSIGETECTSLVSWTASNFIGEGALVFQGEDGEIFSDNLMEPLPPDGGVPRTVTVNNNTFTISDSDGSYNNSVRAEIECDQGVGAWADGVCAPRPVINISAAQNLIRSGNVAVLNVQVDSDFVLDCNIEGGLNYSFVHDNSPTPISYPPITTGPLTSASVITITCASAVYPSIVSTEEVRVNVVPIVQER